MAQNILQAESPCVEGSPKVYCRESRSVHDPTFAEVSRGYRSGVLSRFRGRREEQHILTEENNDRCVARRDPCYLREVKMADRKRRDSPQAREKAGLRTFNDAQESRGSIRAAGCRCGTCLLELSGMLDISK